MARDMCYYLVYYINSIGRVSYKFLFSNKQKPFDEKRFLFSIKIPNFLIRISDDDIILFFKFLKFQISNGVSLQVAIDNFITNQGKIGILLCVKHCKKQLLSGESFVNSCKSFLDTNTYVFVKNIEKTGDLGAIVDYILEYCFIKIQIKCEIFKKLRMPILSCFFVLIVLGVIIYYMIPVVADVTGDKSISDFVLYCGMFLGAVLVYYVIILFFNGKLLLRDPFIGRIVQNLNLWVFSKNLSLGLKSKFNILESIKISVFALWNIELKKIFFESIYNINSGDSFYKSIEKSVVLGDNFVNAVKIGEGNNSIQSTMENFSQSTYDDIVNDLDKISANLTVFLNVFSGLVLVVILLNVIGPIYELADKMESIF